MCRGRRGGEGRKGGREDGRKGNPNQVEIIWSCLVSYRGFALSVAGPLAYISRFVLRQWVPVPTALLRLAYNRSFVSCVRGGGGAGDRAVSELWACHVNKYVWIVRSYRALCSQPECFDLFEGWGWLPLLPIACEYLLRANIILYLDPLHNFLKEVRTKNKDMILVLNLEPDFLGGGIKTFGGGCVNGFSYFVRKLFRKFYSCTYAPFFSSSFSLTL